MKKNLANIITSTRILGTLIMCFTDVLSKGFYISYIYSGLSDVLDGFIARKLNIQSDLGRKLDSVSDLFFYTVMMIKIWPFLVEYLPQTSWFMTWTIVGIRVSLYLFVSLGQKRLLANHTYLNKLTGFMMFLLPFSLNNSYFIWYSKLVIAVALIAALYELVLIIKGKGEKN